VVEAANIPTTEEADQILVSKGIDVCVDFVTNLGGVRIYEVSVFGLVPCDAKAVVDDTCNLVRKQTKRVFEKAETEHISTRQAARALFEPDVFDTPDI
jgi:glutamate dehydrogenase (NAD(P)+)